MHPKPDDSLTGKARETFAKIIEHVWTEECSLSATTRAYRWSVTGPNFHSLHKLFDEQRRQLDQWLAQLFQRSRAAGVTTPTPEEAASEAQEESAAAAGMPPQQMIDDLLGRHEELSRKLREDVAMLGHRPTVE